MLYGMSFDDAKSFLSSVPHKILVEALADTYKSLYCNRRGEFDESESLAADSAADFVQDVNATFQWVESQATQAKGDLS